MRTILLPMVSVGGPTIIASFSSSSEYLEKRISYCGFLLPSSVPLEMQAFIPDLIVPVVTIIESGARPFAMFADLQRRYSWVLPPVSYRSAEHLVKHVDNAVLRPAEKAARDIERRRRLALRRPQSIGR